jgi:HIRAN domain
MRWESTEYAAKRVVGVTHKNRDGSDRQRILKSCRPGMRVTIAGEPDNPVDPMAVAVRIAGGQQIGYLSAEVAQWVAQWLGSGQVDFACRIKSIEPFETDDGRTMLGAQITMTRLELVPGDPLIVTILKFVGRLFSLAAKSVVVATPTLRSAARAVRVTVATAGRRFDKLARSLVAPVVRTVVSAVKVVDTGLSALAEGNPVMLNVFRVTATIAVCVLVVIAVLFFI